MSAPGCHVTHRYFPATNKKGGEFFTATIVHGISKEKDYARAKYLEIPEQKVADKAKKSEQNYRKDLQNQEEEIRLYRLNEEVSARNDQLDSEITMFKNILEKTEPNPRYVIWQEVHDQDRYNHSLKLQELAFRKRQSNAVVWWVERYLDRLRLHPALKRGFTTAYRKEARLLIIDWELPSFEEFPLVKRYSHNGTEVTKTYFAQEERLNFYNQTIAEIVIRILYEIYRVDTTQYFQKITCNGWQKYLNETNGQKEFGCALTLETDRVALLEIRPEFTNAVRCLKKQGGFLWDHTRGNSHVQPFKRITGSKYSQPIDALRYANNEQKIINIFGVEPFEFEGIVKEFFELEYPENNVTIIRTQQSRDRGVDLRIEHKHKYIHSTTLVQVKQYKDCIAPKDIRDLLGTMVIEKANHGIFVTTSRYGPDSRKIARENNIRLIDGKELIREMRAHNLPYTIYF